MNKSIKNIPKILNKNNIEEAISDYLDLLKNIPLKIESNTILELLTYLKRKEIESGPYPEVSLFESANRIMSDLTILYGVKNLLNGAIPEICFEEYVIEYGNDSKNSNDITANNGKTRLIGEGFNVAKSFFQIKKTSSLKKMDNHPEKDENLISILVYNSDAVSETYIPKNKPNIYHLKVNFDI